MTDRISAERWDLGTLALATAVVPLVWLAALGWSANKSAGTYDQVAQSLPLIQDLLEHAHGDFTQVSYRAELLGGAKIHDVFGTLPVFQLLGWLEVSVVPALNAVLFLTQIACAFFGVRLAYDVARLATGKLHRPRLLPILAIVLLSAFSPTLAWKMTTGHYEEVFGALLGISLVSLFLAQKNKTSSLTLLAMTVVVDLQAFQTKGQELVYGAVFFGLVIVAAMLPLHPLRKLVAPLLVTVGCLGLSLPKLAGMLAHVQSSDAARAIGGDSVVYSYITATFHDWLASMPWGLELIPSGREQGFWHEINFGFGPLVVLLAMLPWSRHRLLVGALAASFVVPILYSMNLPGVTFALTHLCPPLKAFRVPERAILAFALVLPAFATAALLARKCPKLAPGWKSKATLIASGLVLFVVPADLREVLAWGIVLAIVLQPLFQWTLPPRVPSSAVLLVLGLGSLSAFKERLRPYSTEESLIDSPAKIAREMRAAQPELASPLNRIVLHFDLDGYQTNTAYAVGLSSLSGYLNPPRRFLALEAALSGSEVNVLKNYFRLDETAPSFGALQPLYNVKFAAFPEEKKLRMAPLGETAGAAWFSKAITRVDSMNALADALHAVDKTLASEAHEQAWVVSSDDAVAIAGLPTVIAPDCSRARVRSASGEIGQQTFHISVDTPAACPLTVAMTFTTDLHATADGKPLTLFPSYGALTGVWVPPGSREITIEAEAVVPWWSRVAWFVGLALVLGAFVETWLLCGRERAVRAEARRNADLQTQCTT
jgi:hypothetical protein